jgi:hypothetical protein
MYVASTKTWPDHAPPHGLWRQLLNAPVDVKVRTPDHPAAGQFFLLIPFRTSFICSLENT